MSAPAATGVICPLCGWTGPEFLPQGRLARPNALCGKCSSLERHRALYLYLRDKTQLLAGETRLLHFAPERALREVFESDGAIEYVTTDLEMSDVSVRMDICELLFKDATFDCVICSHVLEHVPDDRLAIREILRVLKPQGLALIMVPINRPATFEDPAAVTPEEREQAFGQRDHVRIYGEDFSDRLRETGFDVEEVEPGRDFEPGSVETFGLYSQERIFVCRRGRVQAELRAAAHPRAIPFAHRGDRRLQHAHLGRRRDAATRFHRALLQGRTGCAQSDRGGARAGRCFRPADDSRSAERSWPGLKNAQGALSASGDHGVRRRRKGGRVLPGHTRSRPGGDARRVASRGPV